MKKPRTRGRTIVKQSAAEFVSSLRATATRFRYNYYIKNQLERRENKKLLQQSRASAREKTRNDQPLVSVLICTYNRSKELTERAIPSVVRQTYTNFEVVIVGDHCTDDTEQRLAQLGDARIRFYNLPRRGDYPSNPFNRWLVAGTVPRNKALELCSGEWIAPLDDDDEFTCDHLEVLLQCATKYDYELVYGVTKMIRGENEVELVGSYPPARRAISHLSVLYNEKLKFFKYNPEAWKAREPADWNLWRRMKEAGVSIGFLDKIVGTHHP
ncbi:MAG: glycosyltransferase family 2 protein [Halobacteriota archaeon]